MRFAFDKAPKPKAFEPVTFSITIENEQDAKMLYNLFGGAAKVYFPERDRIANNLYQILLGQF